MGDALAAVFKSASAIPQSLADAKTYTVEWRYLLQQIRNLKASPHLGEEGAARIYQAALAVPKGHQFDPMIDEKCALMTAINKMALTHKFIPVGDIGDFVEVDRKLYDCTCAPVNGGFIALQPIMAKSVVVCRGELDETNV